MAKSEPRALLYRGRVLHDALRAERVLETELHAVLREKGFATYAEVDLVVLETDGSFSAVARLPPSGDDRSSAVVLENLAAVPPTEDR